MAIAFREFPWPVQALLYLVLAVVLILAGLYVPYSPIQALKSELDRADAEATRLRTEVAQLQVYDRQHAQLRSELESLQKQYETIKAILPEEKEVDEFLRMVQGSGSSAAVEIRRFTAKPVTAKELYYEVPFEVEADGPYFAVLDFFSRIAGLARIINVGDIAFTGIAEAKGRKYPLRPGTTVTGTFIATTFYTKGHEEAAKQPAKAPAKR